MESNFTIGDVVILKSGGPAMTVSKIKNHSMFDSSELPFNGNISTTWFEGNELKGGTFHQDTLELNE